MCIRDSVLTLRPHGAAVEFGVGEGHSLRRIAERMPVTGFDSFDAVSYTHLRAHETVLDLVCRLLLAKKKNHNITV